jgi:histone deacetylase 11
MLLLMLPTCVVQVTETPSLLLVPNAVLRWRLLSPLRYHAAGTMLAAGLALEHGWGINLGGGMHHAHHA